MRNIEDVVRWGNKRHQLDTVARPALHRIVVDGNNDTGSVADTVAHEGGDCGAFWKPVNAPICKPRLIRCALALGVMSFFIPMALRAEVAAPMLEQLIRIAIADNKDLQAARFAEQQARARLIQAGLRPNPRVDITNSNDVMFGNNGEYSAGVGVSQPFPLAHRLVRQQDVARVDIDRVTAEIQDAERRLAGDVASVYYRVIILTRQASARDRLLDIDRHLVDVSRRRFSAAEVSEIDVNAAQLELLRLQQERAMLQSEQLAQISQLNQLLGRPSSQPLALGDTVPSAETAVNVSDLRQIALQRRPDLHAAQLLADRAHADQALARAQRWEDVNVSLSVDQSRLVLDGAPRQSASRALGLSVSIPWPLFNKNQGRIAETRAAQSQADAQLEALTLSIGNEVMAAYAEIGRLRQIVDGYTQNLLPVSERNVQLTQKGYSEGLVPIVEVVQSQRQQGDITAAYLGALDQYLQAWSRLQVAAATYVQ